MKDFSGLKLAQPIIKALNTEGYKQPTPIQNKAIPEILDNSDILGIAQTGTGKTAAFALPILHTLIEQNNPTKRYEPQALILAPTRELAVQINTALKIYGQNTKIRSAAIYGGASTHKQIQTLSRGVHILVATPGRLLDLANQKRLRFKSIQTLVLDEADRMLDMGFLPDLNKIVAMLPKKRQTLLFSATMPKEIQVITDKILNNPVRIEVSAPKVTIENTQQYALFVKRSDKFSLLKELLDDKDLKKVIIFTRTKHGADRLLSSLQQLSIKSDTIHGNKTQNARNRALNKFRTGRIRVLVATDVASRGIDVENITHVINFDLPNEPDNYIHRIGRTARAGASGVALSFCDLEERDYLNKIEKIIRQKIPLFDEHSFHSPDVLNSKVKKTKKTRTRKRTFSSKKRRQKKRNKKLTVKAA